MNHINLNYHEIAQELDNIPHGHKTAWKKSLCDELDLSLDQLHYRIREARGPAKRVVRKRDERKREIATMVVEMKQRGMTRSEKEHEMSTQRCLIRLVRKGLVDGQVDRLGRLEDCEVSPGHCNRIIRDELLWREPRAHVRIETMYALQEVQSDFSHSKYFKIAGYSEENEDWILKASGRALSYKDNPNKFKPILAGVIDHYSRLRLVRCYPGCAESTNIAFAMLNYWLTRQDDDHLMQHLPWTLAVDNGAPWKSQEFNEMIKALDINKRVTQPYEKTGLGMVERHWQHVWRWELEWSEDYPELPMSEYNAMLHHECVREQELPHPESAKTRGQLYQQSILQTRPHSVDVDLIEVATRTWTRRVKDLRVTVNGKAFKVPQYVGSTWTNGKQIRVSRNMNGEWIGELINEFAKPFTMKPYEKTEYGTYSANADTYEEQIKKDIDKGYSLYRDVNSKEAYQVDTETGEVLNNEQKPKALTPKKTIREAESPFTQQPEVYFASRYEAKGWIGEKLAANEITFSEVQRLFDGLLDDKQPEKAPIMERISQLTDKLKATGA